MDNTYYLARRTEVSCTVDAMSATLESSIKFQIAEPRTGADPEIPCRPPDEEDTFFSKLSACALIPISAG